MNAYIHIRTFCMYVGKTVAQYEQLCSDCGSDCKGFKMYENHGDAGNGLAPGDM